MDPNAFDPNWKDKIHNPKLLNVFNKELGSGIDLSDYALGGALEAPDAYDTGYVATGDYDYNTGYVGTGNYSGMSYGL